MGAHGYRFKDHTIPGEALDVSVNGYDLYYIPLLTDEQMDRGETFDEVVAAFLAHPDRDQFIIRPGHCLWDDKQEAARLQDWLCEHEGY